MESLGPLAILYTCVILILAYAVRGSAGFGAVTIPLLAWVVPLKIVVPLVTLLGVLSSAAILRTNLRHVSWHHMWRPMPLTLVGVGLGLWLFDTLDARTLARALAIFLLCYGTYALWALSRPASPSRVPHALTLPVTAVSAGFVGTLFGAMAGPIYAVYLDQLKLGKHAFRATVAAMLFCLGVARGVGYLAVGAFDRDVLVAFGVGLPMMLIGIWLGNYIHASLDQTMFRRAVAVVLMLSGIPLLFK
jgi:uncharacterized membrane protein YfcA